MTAGQFGKARGRQAPHAAGDRSLNRGSARLMGKESAFTQNAARTHQRHVDAGLGILIVNAQAAALNKIKRAINRATFDQDLTTGQRESLHVGGQNIPVGLAKLTAQTIGCGCTGYSLHETLDIGPHNLHWSVHIHDGAKIPVCRPGGKHCGRFITFNYTLIFTKLQ